MADEPSGRGRRQRSRIEKRLVAAGRELANQREQLAILQEQARALAEDAEVARLDQVVSDHPGRNAVAREAAGHLQRFENATAGVKRRIAELEGLQNELLAKLVV